jgi:hypothetical protein
MKKLAIILSVAAVALAAVLVTSCKKDPKHMNPTEVVQAAYDAFIAKDFATFFSFYDMTPDVQQAWTETLTNKAKTEDFNGYTDFTIKESKIDGDTATVKLWVKDSKGVVDETNQKLIKTPNGWKMEWSLNEYKN